MPVPQIPMGMPTPAHGGPAIPRSGPMHVGDLDTGTGRSRKRRGLSDDEYGDENEEDEEDERVEIFVPEDDVDDEEDDEDDRPRRLVRQGDDMGPARGRYGSPDEDDGEAIIPWVLVRLRPYRYRESKRAWKHVDTTGLEGSPPHGKTIPSSIRLITWNIDMASKMERERFRGALRHIREDVLNCKTLDQPPTPGSSQGCIIMFQEVKAELFADIQEDTWIRRHFIVLPIDANKWPEDAWYGNVTLVQRGIPIAEAHILHFGLTSMQRTALCVKVKLAHPGTQDTSVVAFVNTHLESLAEGADARHRQLEMCAFFLKGRGGVVAGDMNMILNEDEGMERDVGLRDAWKGKLKMKASAAGNETGEEAGNTWGYQGQTHGGKFPPNRLDRIFYSPGTGFKIDEPKRIGVGVVIREGPWVSDHYGLETTLSLLKPRSNSA